MRSDSETTGATGGWGGLAFTNISAATTTASNQFATFSLTASYGYKVSYTTISRFDYRRSNTGPTNGVLQFQVGTNAFVDITNFTYSNAANGAANPPVDLSGFAALQNVRAGTNVTFRLVNYNAGGLTGTWYVWDFAGSSAADLSLLGSVTQIASVTNAPALAPVISLAGFSANQFSFTLTGTAGTNYVVQANTNLLSTNWISLTTNAAPFTFIQSNASAFSQRFYRAKIWP